MNQDLNVKSVTVRYNAEEGRFNVAVLEQDVWGASHSDLTRMFEDINTRCMGNFGEHSKHLQERSKGYCYVILSLIPLLAMTIGTAWVRSKYYLIIGFIIFTLIFLSGLIKIVKNYSLIKSFGGQCRTQITSILERYNESYLNPRNIDARMEDDSDLNEIGGPNPVTYSNNFDLHFNIEIRRT